MLKEQLEKVMTAYSAYEEKERELLVVKGKYEALMETLMNDVLRYKEGEKIAIPELMHRVLGLKGD